MRCFRKDPPSSTELPAIAASSAGDVSAGIELVVRGELKDAAQLGGTP
ncbi:hypothetical protein GL263_02800 [Streptomyces durbertensis]|uniref:Uncharacterized protein n=1 Tax=Streptomyces durbertensis TaxID=2448886 RepID=A0ABR6EDC4_9ACTN|nr:hypothetical protein [Streptomyces durbertensis]MBB1242504.1 hypothetical protein [Streptomyces durbertensis]